jgi:hypothetical protein
MARIPSYGADRVDQAITPSIRESGIPSAETFGGGQTSAGMFGAAQQSANLAGKMFQEQLDRGIKTAADEASTSIINEANRLKLETQKATGKNALEAASKAVADFDTFHGELDRKLGNPTVKELVRSQYRQAKANLGAFSERHAAQQMEIFEGQTHEAKLKSWRDSAASDWTPGNTATAVMAQKLEIEDYGRSKGHPPEMIELLKSRAASDTHADVIQGMLNAGMVMSAKDYFEVNQKELVGNDAVRIPRMMQTETTLGDAQREVDKVFTNYVDWNTGEEHDVPTSEEAAMEEIRRIKNPEVRERAERLARERWHGLVRSREIERKQLMVDAVNQIDGGRRFDDLPATLRDTMTATERKTLRNYAKGEVVTDQTQWYALNLMAADPSTREKFKRLNLMPYLDKFDKTDFEEVVKLQTGLIKDSAKEKQEADGFMGVAAIVNGSVDGVIPPGLERNRFNRVVNEKVRLWKAEHKTTFIPDKEVELMVDDLLKPMVKPGFMGQTWGPFGEPELKYAHKARVAELAGKVPIVERDAILSDFKARGIVWDDLMIMEAYVRRMKQREEEANKKKPDGGK